MVLGAHFNTTPATPGADDNASAVAVLLEVARLLSGLQPRRTIRFVAFPCEEAPHFHSGEMGSQFYASQCQARNEQIIGMLCLEMVGYYSTLPGSHACPARFQNSCGGRFRAAAISWRRSETFAPGGCCGNFAVDSKGLCVSPCSRSDCRKRSTTSGVPITHSFWDHGYPALMLTDTSYLAIRTTTN